MTLLLNKSPAEGAGSPTNSTAGAVFYSRFRSVINAYLVTVCDQLVPILIGQINENQALVGDIILGMLEKLAKDRTLRKQWANFCLSTHVHLEGTHGLLVVNVTRT